MSDKRAATTSLLLAIVRLALIIIVVRSPVGRVGVVTALFTLVSIARAHVTTEAPLTERKVVRSVLSSPS